MQSVQTEFIIHVIGIVHGFTTPTHTSRHKMPKLLAEKKRKNQETKIGPRTTKRYLDFCYSCAADSFCKHYICSQK